MEQFLQVLRAIGIDFVLIISGCSGAVSLLTSKKNTAMNWKEKASIFLAGGLSANYLTPLVIHLTNLSDDYRAGFGFLIGYSGLKTVEFLIKKMHDRVDGNSNKNIEDEK
nr:hypothetical protein [uncultured Flavobacterium sp.]